MAPTLSSNQLAQQLLNRYRQIKVLDVAAFNQDLMKAEPEVIKILRTFPGTKPLLEHFDRLQNNQTPVDKIDPDVMPFSTIIQTVVKPVVDEQTDSEPANVIEPETSVEKVSEPIARALVRFDSTYEALQRYEKEFGNDWMTVFEKEIHDKTATRDQHDQLKAILSFKEAIDLWFEAKQLVDKPDAKAISQLLDQHSDALLKFGDEGSKLVETLKTLAVA